jgi:hypothetical protein
MRIPRNILQYFFEQCDVVTFPTTALSACFWQLQQEPRIPSEADRRSVGQSVLDFYHCQDSCWFVDVGRCLWREDRSVVLQLLLVLASADIFGSDSRGTRDHILLSQIRDFPFRCLLRLAGLRWRYLNPPPHESLFRMPWLNKTMITKPMYWLDI